MQLDSEFIMAVRRCADVMQCEFGSLLTAQVHDAVQCDLMLISRATMRCDAFCMEASRCDATRYKRNRFPIVCRFERASPRPCSYAHNFASDPNALAFWALSATWDAGLRVAWKTSQHPK
jgi:hypothetical protein